MLDPEELIWLNCYHAHVLEKIGPTLSGSDLRVAAKGLRADWRLTVIPATCAGPRFLLRLRSKAGPRFRGNDELVLYSDHMFP